MGRPKAQDPADRRSAWPILLRSPAPHALPRIIPYAAGRLNLQSKAKYAGALRLYYGLTHI